MFTAEIFNPLLYKWEDVREKILFLENEAFGKEAFNESELQTDFSDKNNVVVLLRDNDSDEIIGFTYAKPFEPETDDSPAKRGETVWMWDTIIKKEYRGRGLLKVMMSTIEEELKNRGFKYLERNALVANNFAENIGKHYKDRIIKSFPLDSRWGPQIFFRIKL